MISTKYLFIQLVYDQIQTKTVCFLDISSLPAECFFLWSLTTPSISASYNRAFSDVMSAMYISINLIIPLIMEICQSTCLKPARAGGSQTNCRQIQRFILCPAPVRSLSWGQSKPYVNEVAFGYVKGLTHIHLAFRSAFKIASNNR